MKYDTTLEDRLTAIEVIEKHIAQAKKAINNLENIKATGKDHEKQRLNMIERWEEQIEVLEKAIHIIR